MACQLVGGEWLGPNGEEAERFLPDHFRLRQIGRELKQAVGILRSADPESIVYEAAQHERRPSADGEIVQQLGDARALCDHVVVADRANRLVGDLGVNVGDEARDSGAFHPAQCDRGGEAHGGGLVSDERGKRRRFVGHALQRVNAGMAEVDVAVVIFPEEIADRAVVADHLALARQQRGEEADAQ